jgi:hypothetical protein
MMELLIDLNIRRGSPENPVTRADVLQKFRDNVRHLPPATPERIIQLVDALDIGDGFGELTEILGAENHLYGRAAGGGRIV